MCLLRRFNLADLPYELLELLNARLSDLNELLCVLVNAIVRVQLLLQLNDRLVAFIESRGKRNHDVPLLEQQLLVSVHLCLFFFDLRALPLHFLQFKLILLPDQFLFLLQERAKLRGLLDLLPADEHLRVKRPYFLFKSLFLLSLHDKVAVAFLECGDSSCLVLFSPPFLLFELHEV